jgi:hypothetical protein
VKDLRAAYTLFMSQPTTDLVFGFLIIAVALCTMAGLLVVIPN